MTIDALSRSSLRLGPRLTRWLLAVAVGSGVFSGSAFSGGVALAAGPGAENGSRGADFLTWHAPPGCGAAAAIAERVSELLGQRDIELERVQRVEGRVRETRGGWALTLRLFDASGVRERELTSRECSDLPEAAAVAITLAFEAAREHEAAALESEAAGARGVARSSEAAPAAESDAAIGSARASVSAPEVTATLTPERTASVDAAQAASRAGPQGLSGPRWALGAEALIDASALPAAAPGASLLGLLRWDEMRLGAFLGWLPNARQKVGPGQDVDFSLLVAGLRGCYALGHGLVDTALCAGLEAGQLSARGSGLAEARTAHDLWMAPQLGLELSAQPSPRLTLQLHAEGVAPLFRQGYAVNDTDDIHHVASVGVRVGLGGLFAL